MHKGVKNDSANVISTINLSTGSFRFFFLNRESCRKYQHYVLKVGCMRVAISFLVS